MKIQVDGHCVYELDDKMLKVLAHDIGEGMLNADIKRRVRWVVEHKYTQVKKRLIQQWFPILQERYESLPAKDDKLIDLIFQQPDYQKDTNFYLDNQSDDDRQSKNFE